jgi:hypothetical protein
MANVDTDGLLHTIDVGLQSEIRVLGYCVGDIIVGATDIVIILETYLSAMQNRFRIECLIRD